MFKCNECIRTFSRRSSLSNHIKTHTSDHIDEQMRIATEELKESHEQEAQRYSPIRYLPIVEDIVEDIDDDIDDQDDDDDVFDTNSSDEILGADIIGDNRSDEVNNLFICHL